MVSESRSRSSIAAVGRGAALGSLTGSLAALIDASATLLGGFQGDRGWFVVYCWVLLVAWASSLGGAFAGWLELLRAGFEAGPATERSPRRRLARWLLHCTAAALPVLAFVWWVPSSWVSEHWVELARRGRALVILSYVLLFLGTTSLSLVVSWLARRFAGGGLPWLQRLLLPALLLVAAACYAADRVILVGLYEDFHYGLFAGFSLSLGACVVLGAALLRARGRAPADGCRGFIPLVGAWALVGAFQFFSVDVFGPSRSLAFSKLVGTGRALTDFDADGFSGWFGGSDCAGFDPRSGPGRFDFPGNGVDEDCLGGDARWPQPRPRVDYPVPERPGYDLVLITIDTLRADHLGLHGYPRNTSPHLDALARRSLVFERAFAAAPKTYDSLPALFSGLYPSNIPRDYSRPNHSKRWRKSRFDGRGYVYEIGSDATLLTELLQRRGYHTVGCSSLALLPLLGLARGFDLFSQARECRSVLAQAKDAPEPLFFWTHLFAPHSPYVRHREFDFGTQDIDRYDSEIARDDAEIGALLEIVAQRGRADRTIVIVTSDHGEEFREHGGEDHSLRLYRELIHVPLLVHIPGVEARRVAAPVEILSVVPTLCELLGLEKPCDDHDAVSLFRTLHDPAQPSSAVSEVNRPVLGTIRRSLYTEAWHLLLDEQQDRVELYDVERDPNEQQDVATQHPEVVARLREELQGRLQYRAARLFEAYASHADPLQLAQGLPALQDERLLERAIEELERHPSPALSEDLQRLARRPGLRDDLRTRALALTAQPQAR